MSLVAYASSDSEQSDTEEQADDVVSKETQISDPSSNKGNENGNAVVAISGEISDSDSEGDGSNNTGVTDETDKDINFLLKALPEPKYETPKHIEENDELEEEVKPKAAQVADAPKPPPKKSKQPVKFTVPSVDVDSDEDEPSRKKSKTSNSRDGKSGLFALLPAPVHAAKKETNRLLIPHTLTKKPVQTTKQKPKNSVTDMTSQKSKSTKLSSYSDSDDEEEESPSSFFSLDSNRLPGPMPPDPATSIKTNKLNLPPPTMSHVTGIQTDTSINSSSNLSLSNNIRTSDVPSMDAPLNFGPSSQNILPFHSQNAPLTFKTSYQSVGPSLPDPMQYPQQSSSEMMDYSQYEEPFESHDPVLPGINEPEGLMQDEEFLRLQGKKQRGKEEINIIDVNADDFISTVDVHKSLSEEQTVQQSHKKKDGPTSQQKRKHQITYLAHQAKERELSLKNQWAQNRMTKRQTQAKYGF